MTELEKELSPDDFKESKTNWIKYSRGTVTEFELKIFCPAVFRNILEIQNVDYNEYMLSVSEEDLIRKVAFPGKCGTVILPSMDDRFVVKVLRKSEVKVILDMLPNYYLHMKTYRASLLSKLYGLHLVRPAGGVKVYFAVLSNEMKSDLRMHSFYDLKGSPKGRNSSKVVVDEGAIQKDVDLDFCFYLDPLVRHRLIRQIKYDCEFLEAEGIMNYSFLLGIHIEAQNEGEFIGRSPTSGKQSTCGRSSISKRELSKCTSEGFDNAEITLSHFYSEKNSSVCSPGYKFGEKMPARAVRTQKHEIGSVYKMVTAEEYYNVFMNFRIVDFFKNYNVAKRIEHVYKSLQYDSKSISAVNPKAYSSRFQDFLCRILQEDPGSSSLEWGSISSNKQERRQELELTFSSGVYNFDNTSRS